MVADNETQVIIEQLLTEVEILKATLDGIRNEELKYLVENAEAPRWIFLLLGAFNIFIMQAGFALLEVGTVQAKNAKSILFKNMLDSAISMMIWWFVGFGIAGDAASGQVGRSFFFVLAENTQAFIHSYVFAGTTATIVSGAVAERMNFAAYLAFSVVMVAGIYPCLVWHAWGSGGWLAAIGYLDYAGSGVIHLCGGCAALLAAQRVGARLGRFKVDQADGTIEILKIKGHSPVLSAYGTFLLQFGWLSFNGTSCLGGDLASMRVAARAVMNTLLGTMGAGLASFVWDQRHMFKPGAIPVHNLEELCNALLAGAVGTTGACAYVEGWAALLIGVCSFAVYTQAANLIKGLHIDDPLEASAVHGATGLWGVLAAGLFANPSAALGAQAGPTMMHGLFIKGSPRLLGAQIAGALVIISWTSIVSLLSLQLINLIPGFHLRVDKDIELLGLDFAYHDGFAYPDLSADKVVLHNELKAAERRVEARNRGRKLENKKVQQLGVRNKRRKVIVNANGEKVSISATDSHASSHQSFNASSLSSFPSISFKTAKANKHKCRAKNETQQIQVASKAPAVGSARADNKMGGTFINDGRGGTCHDDDAHLVISEEEEETNTVTTEDV